MSVTQMKPAEEGVIERLQSTSEVRPTVLSLNIKDRSALFAAYMPFLKGGGLFVPADRSYALGEEVFMLLTLLDLPEKLPVAGTVAWITPKGAQGGRTAGVGIRFSEKDAGAAQERIETLLGGALQSKRQTHTM